MAVLLQSDDRGPDLTSLAGRQFTGIEIVNGLLKLFTCVHHKGTVFGNRFIYRLTFAVQNFRPGIACDDGHSALAMKQNC